MVNRRMKYLLTSIALGTLLSPAFALHVRNYAAGRHERFSSGFPSTPVANSGFMHSGVDLSATGWDVSYPVRQVTLITPQHFVCANHFPPPVGGQIQFLSSSGVLRTGVVQALANILNANG